MPFGNLPIDISKFSFGNSFTVYQTDLSKNN